MPDLMNHIILGPGQIFKCFGIKFFTEGACLELSIMVREC